MNNILYYNRTITALMNKTYSYIILKQNLNIMWITYILSVLSRGTSSTTGTHWTLKQESRRKKI